MKRYGKLYNHICSMENLRLADAKARLGKSWQYGVQVHQKNEEANLLMLQDALLNKTYRTSAYTVFTIHEPKEREIYRLPYYPDRITHHAVMNVLEPLFVKSFTADTYSCIKKRGIHAAANAVKRALQDQPGTQYCLKLDIRKFYPSINHAILKSLLRRKFKDAELLWLLDEIIDSAPGLPIGNYLSQYLANFYLTRFDHWLKQTMNARYYFRYADDLVILSHSKQYLHQLLLSIKQYLQQQLQLEVKSNWQVFPVAARGIDFVGYRFYHAHTRLRKSIKQNFARMLATNPNPQSIASYKGWMKHCNANHLTKTLLHEFLFTTEHKAACTGFHRRQDKTAPGTQSNHQSNQVQNRSQQVYGQRQWPAANHADRIQPGTVHHFQWQHHTDGNDKASAGRQVSIYHQN